MKISEAHSNALLESLALQDRISATGFDWPDVQGVVDKLAEETEELREALAAGDRAAIRHEIGDILLVAVNLCRFLDCNPNEVLHESNKRFENRYTVMVRALAEKGASPESCTLEEMDQVWDEVKGRADKELGNAS